MAPIYLNGILTLLAAHSHDDPGATALSAANAGALLLALLGAAAAVFLVRAALRRSSAARVPCAECGRYISPAETECPFCGAAPVPDHDTPPDEPA